MRLGEDKALTAYYRDVERYPLLTQDEEKTLVIRMCKGDKSARDRLVNANLRFVIHVAKSFQSQGLSLPDLINEGNLGLMTAARKFDPEKGCRFITYAVWWIRQNIHKALETQTRSVRVPANVLNDLARFRRAETELTQVLDRAPTKDELSAETDFDRAKTDHTLGATYQTLSLDSLRYDQGDISYMETLPDDSAISPDEPLYRETSHSEVRSALGALNPRLQTVLALHYGMNGDEPKTYQQIGLHLGVSRERVRQLKEEALHRLRQKESGKRLFSLRN
jgi:RNA polymerase primary sigma factor